MRTRRAALGSILAVVVGAGCGHKKRRRVPVPPAPPRAPGPGYTETGVASWYGHPYHGRQAANGEIYDMEKLTAAHRTLPFDTWVRVVDLDNSKTVEVRIIDRGPFIDGRIIDLSHAAAKAIEMIGPGIAKVRLEIVKASPSPGVAVYGVQVGAFRERSNAENLRGQMAARYGAAKIVRRPGNPDMWRVLVGAEPSEDAARELSKRIRGDSVEKIAPLIVRIDTV
jgi:rare lipoprotein A